MPYGIGKPRPPPAPRPPRKHDVAPESGAEGLNPEYMFTSRSARPDSAFSNKENYFMDDSASFYDNFDIDSEGNLC